MIGKMIRYLVLVLVVIGVALIVGTVINNNSDKNFLDKNKTYSVVIRVKDRETRKVITGGEFILKTSDGKVIEEWVLNDEVKRISKLENGTYMIVQKSAALGYETSEEVTFKIYNEEKEITIYNDAIIEEIIGNKEVFVDNTLSMKNGINYIISFIIIGIGALLVNKRKFCFK